MLARRTAVTGMGIISSLSLTLDGLWDSLQSGRSGVCSFRWEDGTAVPVSVAAPSLFTGKIEDFDISDTALKKAVKKSQKVMSREIQTAVAASCRALNNADILFGQFPPESVGISFGSDYIITTPEDVTDGIRAVCRKSETGKFDFTLWAENGLPKMQPLWQLKYLPNMPSSHIAILNNFHGPSNSITLREASIGAVIGEASAIIRNGRADVMLTGTTGSRIHPFKMLAAMQQEELSPDICRPFDKNRQGTILGECAGALVLEEKEHAEKRGVPVLAEIVAASYRINRSSGGEANIRGAVAAVLRAVLKQAEMLPEEIGFICAHGLGSPQTDREEALAINDVFGTRKTPIPVAAAKGFIGNAGAGTGAVELIAGILSLQHGTVFPTLNYETPDSECPVSVSARTDIPSGNSFIKIAFNRQGQASAVLVKRPC
ncbi:3-oxoacyl-ACP synthase [Planctomycetales bacterium]|nr:3-oxoacyl-ACP synthase [Planctomycetales bacterium]